jgi:hypothetical protein
MERNFHKWAWVWSTTSNPAISRMGTIQSGVDGRQPLNGHAVN